MPARDDRSLAVSETAADHQAEKRERVRVRVRGQADAWCCGYGEEAPMGFDRGTAAVEVADMEAEDEE